MQKGNSRPVFQTVKKLIKPFQPCTIAIRDSTGKKLTDSGRCVKDGLEELYEDITIDVQEREPPPLKEEINHALLRSAHWKASGPDNIAIKLLWFGGENDDTKQATRDLYRGMGDWHLAR